MREPRLNTINELPDWARPTIEKLFNDGILNGADAGLDLSHDMVRMLVVLGGFEAWAAFLLPR